MMKNLKHSRFLFIQVAISLLIAGIADASEEAFEQFIQPIFETRCVSCHGAERQKSGLRLDTREALLKGGDSGPAVVPGDPSKSLLFDLISSHPDDDGHMPPKDEPLNDRQKFLVESWIKAGAPWKGTLVAKKDVESVELVGSPYSDPNGFDLTTPKDQARASQYIDFLIDRGLEVQGLSPGEMVSDTTFLRRAYLDIAGRIPTLVEYEDFVNSEAPNKRHALIDELLDAPGYVSHSQNYWLDALRAKDNVGKNSLAPYQQWVVESIKENQPFDEFAYELVAAEGRISDPENGSAGYYLREDNIGFMAEDSISNTMQLFLATDMVCAQCHDHPYKKWTQKDFYHLLGFVNGTVVHGTAINKSDIRDIFEVLKPPTTPIKNRYAGAFKSLYRGAFKGGSGAINLPDTYKYDDGKPNELVLAKPPFGKEVEIDYDNPSPNEEFHFIDHVRKNKSEDVRSRMHFAKWITDPENPMFTKTIVNRLWGRAFGAPLVGNYLDLEEDELGENPHLTTFLIELMKRADYDQKLLLSVLYKTNSYQRKAVAKENENQFYPAPRQKRLSSEQMWDSLLAIRKKNPDEDIMAGSLTLSNMSFYEMEKRSQAERLQYAKDGRGDSSIKKEYDLVPTFRLGERSRRASLLSGRNNGPGRGFLGAYGKSDRGSIDNAKREATIPQALLLMNDELYAGELSSSYLYDRLKSEDYRSASSKISLIYNAILTREPTSAEETLAKTKLRKNGEFDQDTLIWALANSHEFKFTL